MEKIRFSDAKNIIKEIRPYLDGFYVGGFGALLRFGSSNRNVVSDLGSTIDIDMVLPDKILEEKSKKYNFDIVIANFVDKEVKVPGLIGYFEYLYSPFYLKNASTDALWGGNPVDFFTESTGIGAIDATAIMGDYETISIDHSKAKVGNLSVFFATNVNPLALTPQRFGRIAYLLFDNLIEKGIEDTKSEIQKGADYIISGNARVNEAIKLAKSDAKFSHVLGNLDYTTYMERLYRLPLRIEGGDLYKGLHKAAKRMHSVREEDKIIEAIKGVLRK